MDTPMTTASADRADGAEATAATASQTPQDALAGLPDHDPLASPSGRRGARRRGPRGSGKKRRNFGRVFQKPTSPNWYARFPDPQRRMAPNGRAREVVRALPTKKAAEALLAEVRTALMSGTYALPPASPGAGGGTGGDVAAGADAPLTVLGAIDEYVVAKEAEGKAVKTLRRYRSNRTAISASALGSMPAASVRPEDVETFRAWRRERRWKVTRKVGGKVGDPVEVSEHKGSATNATVNRDLLLIGAAFNRLVRLRRLPENPVSRVTKGKEVRRPRVVLGKEEVRALVAACSPSLRPLVLGGLYSGARLGELTRLTWSDISFQNGTISLFRPKVGNSSAIPLHPVLAAELKRLREDRGKKGNRVVPDNEFVFLSNRGTPWVTYRTTWATALRKAGLGEKEGLSFHSLRHTFACHYLEGGAAVTDLKGLLGHASLSTTQRYCEMVDGRTRESLVALDYGSSGKVHKVPRKARQKAAV